MPTFGKLIVAGLLAASTCGCAANYYNVPRETYEKKVRVLGVSPVMVDAGSDIRHPERESVVSLLREASRKNEKELIGQIKEAGNYFNVRLLDEDAERLFETIVSRRERREDAGVTYNKYFYKPEEIKGLVARNNLDAVMLVTLGGINRHDKIYSSNYLSYLEGDYNDLVLTAQILDGEGTVLWEYPNFRQRLISYPSFLALQYPDFDEARANAIDEVEVKFKTVKGLERALNKKEKSGVLKGSEVSVAFSSQFEQMTGLLRGATNAFGTGKDEAKKVDAVPAQPAVK
ncbi:MAG TPA: hypothetical protein VIU41_07515 [Geobacteraceae bacterium]